MGIVSLSELVKVPPLDRWQGCGSRHSIKHTRLQYLLRVRNQAQCLWGHHHLILQDGTVCPHCFDEKTKARLSMASEVRVMRLQGTR